MLLYFLLFMGKTAGTRLQQATVISYMVRTMITKQATNVLKENGIYMQSLVGLPVPTFTDACRRGALLIHCAVIMEFSDYLPRGL